MGFEKEFDFGIDLIGGRLGKTGILFGDCFG
jgi:hypothetical protein